jgi:hypothetical protein
MYENSKMKPSKSVSSGEERGRLRGVRQGEFDNSIL